VIVIGAVLVPPLPSLVPTVVVTLETPVGIAGETAFDGPDSPLALAPVTSNSTVPAVRPVAV
jgi:hypothetical protein